MTATAANAVPPPAGVVAGILREERGAWLFVLRTAIALYLTGWLAMRFALPQPGTAMLTVFVVANRQTGMVLAKSFYRVIGTLFGAAVALLLLGLFPQQRVPLLLALAAWIGFCAGGALMFRNFTAYSFVLSGYTASIIAVPAIANPLSGFESAVARISEVLLGIAVTGVISDTMFPTRLRDTLLHTARTQFQHFIRFVTSAADGGADVAAVEQAHLRSLRESTALEDLRSSVIFEDPVTRARSEHLQAFNHHFMAASTSLQSLHHLLARLRRIGRERAVPALQTQYRTLGAALDVPAGVETMAPLLIPRLEQVRPQLVDNAQRLRATLGSETVDFDTGNVLVLRLADELLRYARAALELRAPRVSGLGERMRFVRSNDVAGATLAGMRGMLTMLAVGVFWIASAWPSGSGAMLNAAIFCAIFASSPDPLHSAQQALIGWAGGLVVAFICVFFVLSQSSGFELLVTGTLPVVLMSSYLLTRPRWVGIGTGFCISFISNLTIANNMSYDPAAFFNNGVALMVGVTMAYAAFLLIPTHSVLPWFQQRQFARLRAHIAVAANAPLPGLLPRFESGVRDLLQQILARSQGDSGDQGALAWGLAVQETGRALIELRQAAVALPPESAGPVERAVAAMAHFYRHPDAAGYNATNQAIVAAVGALQAREADTPGAEAVAQHLHLLRLAMVDTASVVAQYRRPDGVAEEKLHAA
ncbi:MAG: FUSC family protein [Proteobacteria bacterium]|uniref:FUSC family protein n=1 Tax=Rudaea sp. TaxID=2136325 RepID=UPI00321FAA53|nr:FUSC family protein [Pseudomonadota bacterium]